MTPPARGPLLRAASFAVAVAGTACGASSSAPPGVPVQDLPPLHLAPTTDLAQAASLSWLIDVAPRALASHAELRPAIDLLFPSGKLASFTARNGFDPLALDEITAAAYSSAKNGDTMLYLARGDLDVAKVTAAFHRVAGVLEGTAIDRSGGERVTRQWGTVLDERAQMATLGDKVAALEVGRFGPLRSAELFAEEKLKRASPALKADPLARAAELLGDAPARAFVLGPFEGASGRVLEGLAAASTAGGIAARPEPGDAGSAALRVTLVLTGGWGGDGPAAAKRLSAALDALAATPAARLAGLDHPVEPPRVESFPDALRMTVLLDPLALARGIRAAGGAQMSEIMSY